MVGPARPGLDGRDERRGRVVGVDEREVGVAPAEQAATDDGQVAVEQSVGPRAGVPRVGRVEEPAAEDRCVEAVRRGPPVEEVLDLGRRPRRPVRMTVRGLVEPRAVGLTGDPDDARKQDLLHPEWSCVEQVLGALQSDAVVAFPLLVAGFRGVGDGRRGVDQHVDVVVHRPFERLRVEDVAASCGTAPGLDGALGSVIPRQSEDLVVAVGESVDESVPQDARGASDEHLHAGVGRHRSGEVLLPDSYGGFIGVEVMPDRMKHVRVRLSAGGHEAEIHPMYDLWVNAPFVERATALQWNFTGDALGILHYAVGDADAFEAAVEDVPEVLGYDVERVGDDAFYVYVRDATTDALGDLFGPITSGGLIVVPPIRYHEDGTVTVSLFGPETEIQTAIESIPDLVDVTVEGVSGLKTTVATVETLLTERQREAVGAAVELGYYEIPRESSHADVAAAIDCAPSTAAEHLRKAEARLVSSTFDR